MFPTVNIRMAAALLVLTAALPLASTHTNARPMCLSDWAAAADVVASQDLVTVEALSRQFRRQKLGDIVKTELCREKGKYVYRLVARTPSGRLKSFTFDARRGIEMGIAETGR